MLSQIKPDSRIGDVIPFLSDPIEYVTGIISNFVSYGYDCDSSEIRIGVSGAGVYPNYKIEKPSRRVTLTIARLQLEMTITPARTFSGRNHREMTELDDCERHGNHWSTARMNFAQLRALLSDLSQSATRH